MPLKTHKVIAFILGVISAKRSFVFWLFVRFVSALIPLISVYQFSRIIKLLENHATTPAILLTVGTLLGLYTVDNFLRIQSTTRLDNIIGTIAFDIHNYFLRDLKTQSRDDRHASVQAVRNFADASVLTLTLFKQPGIDSLVSLVLIPPILFSRDFPAFILSLAYILVYYFIDTYTTQRYAHLKDILNTKTEVYFGKLQDSNDFDLEQRSWSRHFTRVTNWSYHEWFALQSTAVTFYAISLLYLTYSVSSGHKDLSELILIAGYLAQVQPHLNSFSQIKDSLTDMMVGLKHLASNSQVSAIDLDDLI